MIMTEASDCCGENADDDRGRGDLLMAKRLQRCTERENVRACCGRGELRVSRERKSVWGRRRNDWSGMRGRSSKDVRE